jgi:hypothetical protein
MQHSVKCRCQVPFIVAIIIATTCYAIPMEDTQRKSLNMALT